MMPIENFTCPGCGWTEDVMRKPDQWLEVYFCPCCGDQMKKSQEEEFE